MANIITERFATTVDSATRTNNRVALFSVAVLYFMLGFITCLNDTLVPYFKKGFDLSYMRSSLVQFYFFAVYGIFSIPAGRIIERIGYQKGIVCGFVLAAVGCTLFYPAALMHEYYLFLAALFIVAVGIVFMQVAANPYIVVLGPADTASARLNLVQSVGSVGTIVAPLFGAAIILPGMTSAGSSDAVKFPYLGIAMLLVLTGVWISRLSLPVVRAEADDTEQQKNSADRHESFPRSVFGFRNLNLGALGIFFFLGIEIAIASFLTNYIADSLTISEGEANRYVAFYWGGMLVGRLLGVLALKVIRPHRMLVLNAVIAMGLILLSVSSYGTLAVWSLIAVGLFNSVVFAIIFSLAVSGLGKHMTKASGILSTAISGGAFVVVVQGWLIDTSSWATAFLIPVICYFYIIFYGINGYKSKYSAYAQQNL